MAYLIDFISTLCQYVYSIDFMHFMFSSTKNTLVFLSWIFIIVPATIYTVHSYKPKDFPGYVCKGLFWLICGFLVIFSPFSLPLYLIYRQLCVLSRKLNAPKSSVHAKVEPLPIKTPSSDSSSTQPDIQNRDLPQGKTPSYRVCHFMWTRSIIFSESVLKNPSLQCEVYIWTAFFYSIAKHMRNQSLVDEIYSQFKSAVEPFIKSDENKAKTLQRIQSIYWQFRGILNSSGIDPRTQDGISKLWELTAQWAFPDVQFHEGDEIAFRYNVNLLVNHALTLYDLKPPTETTYCMESASGMLVRVPESKLDAWQKVQEGRGAKPTEEQKRIIKEMIIRDIYGSDPE